MAFISAKRMAIISNMLIRSCDWSSDQQPWKSRLIRSRWAPHPYWLASVLTGIRITECLRTHLSVNSSHCSTKWANLPPIGLIVLGFNDTSTLVGHFVSSPREREKRDRKESRRDEKDRKERGTRAGVCKTLCPQLPDSNSLTPTLLSHDGNNSTNIWFQCYFIKGNYSKIGDDWDKKKIRITYFFMRNQNMKFQNISTHGSKLMLYTIKQRH